jgi:hypothetical protein
LISVDLPTFGKPTIATVPESRYPTGSTGLVATLIAAGIASGGQPVTRRAVERRRISPERTDASL